MSDNLSGWLAMLDTLERAMDAADGQREQTFDPPQGPVPEQLRERAENVLARQKLLIDELVVSRANVARELAALRRASTAQSDAPAYLDVRG